MRSLSVAVLGALSLMAVGRPAAASCGLEAAVLYEVNFARTHPADYARELRGDMARVQLPGENARDVAEALDFLSRQKPLPPLSPDAHLEAAARSHALAQGRTVEVGHVGPNGTTLSMRLETHGVRYGLAAENISYGYDDARAVVRQLIVDSGVSDRGHRHNIFTGAYEQAGVSCGPHRQWRSMCVIDFAGAPLRR